MDNEMNVEPNGPAGKKWWVLLVVFGLAALAFGGWHWGRPAYQRLKETRLQTEARASFDRGDYRAAAMSARLALMLNASNLPACRIMADLAELSRSPAALDWRQRIADLDPATTNRIALAATALTFQNPPFPLTVQILDDLGQTAATNLSAYQSVATMLALRQNRPAQAAQHMAAALALEPTNRSFALNLAVLQLHATNSAVVQAARQTLENFCADTNLGPVALRSLVAERLLQKDFPAARDYATRLLATPQAGLGDQLQFLGILQDLADPALPVRLQSVQQQAATNALAAAQTADWMLARGYEPAGWLLSLPAEIQSQPPVQMALAEGYLKAANWPQLCRQTAKGGWGEMDFLRLAYLARAFAELGEPVVSDNQWRSAVERTGGKLGPLNLLLNFAQRWGKPDAVESLLNQIIQKHPGAAWAQQALEQIYLQAGDTAKLYQLYARLLAGQPQNVALKNNAAAVALLLRTNLAQAEQWAAQLYQARPEDAVVVSTYAYALHLQGRNSAGLAALKKLPAQSLQQPAPALYYGLLLAATGDAANARPYLDLARKNPQLLPEEKALLEAAERQSELHK